MPNTPLLLLLLTAGILLLLGVALASYETTASLPATHPQYATIQIGGQRSVDDAANKGLGFVFGLLIVGLLTAFLFFAADHARHAWSLRKAIFAGGLLYASAYAAMMFVLGAQTAEGRPLAWSGFPPATVLMLFGVWFTPLVFTAIYCLGFGRWFALREATANDDPLLAD